MANQYPNMIFEADDVHQEGMTRMIMNVRSGKFLGKSSIHSYLYSICRNICLKQYTGATNVSVNDWILEPSEVNESDYFDLLQMIIDAKGILDENCVDIIDLRLHLEDRQISTSENSITKM